MEPMPLLETRALSKRYGPVKALDSLTLELEPGIIGLVGANGAGKSTLIKAVMGLLPLSSGWVQVFGQPVERMRDKVGYVPQRESVDWNFPVTAMDVVLMGRYGAVPWYRRVSRADRDVARRCPSRDVAWVWACARLDRTGPARSLSRAGPAA